MNSTKLWVVCPVFVALADVSVFPCSYGICHRVSEFSKQSSRISDSTHIENAFLLAIDGYEMVDFLVVESADLAGAKA
jgi:hypothetical protein